MKKLLLLSIVFFGLLLTNCAKEEAPKKACETNNTGTLKITNMSSQTVTITIDGSNYTVSTGNSTTKTVSAGVHNYSATD